MGGQGGYGAAEEIIELAERLGAGVAASLLGKPVLDESLPFHTGVMGHLGTTASAQLMKRCDTLLLVGTNDPWTEFYPMQMNGLAELITVAARWRDWADPRFVVCVLDNRDLAEVSWEQRETEGEPRFPASQDLPPVPYDRWAELLDLRGLKVASPRDMGSAWSAALSADRPTVIHAVVDPAVPLLPPDQPGDKIAPMFAGLSAEEGETARRAERHLRRERADEGYDDPPAGT